MENSQNTKIKENNPETTVKDNPNNTKTKPTLEEIHHRLEEIIN